ncbi:MAG TPA: hypothetical protein VKE95_07120 [Burkholderiales bacterium]|nr:hypothetical protein [Burkholderiales bacterium]
MNRYVIAVAVAVFSSSALALEVGPPFEQTQLDRELPNIQFAPVKPYVADSRAPYEQLVVDRALPDIYFAPVEPYVADSRAPYEQAQVDRQLPDLGRWFETQRQITDGSSVSDVQRRAQP